MDREESEKINLLLEKCISDREEYEKKLSELAEEDYERWLSVIRPEYMERYIESKIESYIRDNLKIKLEQRHSNLLEVLVELNGISVCSETIDMYNFSNLETNETQNI